MANRTIRKSAASSWWEERSKILAEMTKSKPAKAKKVKAKKPTKAKKPAKVKRVVKTKKAKKTKGVRRARRA